MAEEWAADWVHLYGSRPSRPLSLDFSFASAETAAIEQLDSFLSALCQALAGGLHAGLKLS